MVAWVYMAIGFTGADIHLKMPTSKLTAASC